MKVAIIGANGNIGGRLGEILADRGHEPMGFIRKEEQSGALESLGMKTQIADLVSTETSDYASMLEGMDALVFTAGAGGAGVEMTQAIDGEGVEKMIEAAKSAGVNRFLLVSAFPDAWRDKDMPDGFEFYMKMKRQADVALADSSLNWTILRPGTLTDEKGGGNVKLGPVIPYGDVSRDHVAQVLAELLNNEETGRLVLELTDGDTSVKEAVEHQNRPLRSR